MIPTITQFVRRLLWHTVVLAIVLPGAVARCGQPLFPNSDFEAGSLTGWKQVGEAFQFQPTKGDNSHARGRESSSHEGRFLVGGFEKFDGQQGQPGDIYSDDAVGELISPQFTVNKRYMTFLIGGGNHPGEAGVKLLCDGKRWIWPRGRIPKRSRRYSHDVSQFLGKSAQTCCL